MDGHRCNRGNYTHRACYRLRRWSNSQEQKRGKRGTGSHKRNLVETLQRYSHFSPPQTSGISLKVGATWQIVLNNSTGIGTGNFDPVEVYDIDLFDNTASTISALHSSGKKVICYFSAGSYEDWRPDANQFPSSAMGNKLDNWPGEKWIDTNSGVIRSIMKARLDMAVTKNCDAVDPDNIDAYDNDNGLSLTTSDAINYVNFLANEAHSRGLACGLKNGGKIVPSVMSTVDFEVNEQCVQYNECNKYTEFITQGKPVFHIEYPNDTSAVGIQSFCTGANTSGFSTVIKHLGLDEFYETC